MSITKTHYGKMPDGSDVFAYTLTNDSGSSVKILNLGGIVESVIVPDKNGKHDDICCGFDTVDGYLNGGGYFGALVGRCANRIGGARFTLNGVEYQLAKNDGENHLHGGDIGYNRRIWDVEAIEGGGGKPDRLILSLLSPDGEENYPGRAEIKVTYSWGVANILSIHYEAVCDKDTVMNLTNHSYFNLEGIGGGDVRENELFVAAVYMTPVDEGLIPTGEVRPVEGTEYDFRERRRIEIPLDNNFCLDMSREDGPAAQLYSPKTGRKISVYTDQPGIQIYNGVMMDGAVPFRGGVPQRLFHAIALETQVWPDAANQPDFPSAVLRMGEKYDTTTTYVFGVE
ncbi:MAG: galactose mutarotase [Clostridiales bacterium]|jgi:aldose 1-epimerase|nr:galactose mutarotase [Clostridiales bacterium]